MPACVKLLVGAPLYETCLDASSCTVNELLPAFVQHVKPTRAMLKTSFQPGVTGVYNSSKPCSWRSLDINNAHLSTGYSQLSWIGHTPLSEGLVPARFYQVPASVRRGSGMQWFETDSTNDLTGKANTMLDSSDASDEESGNESFLEQSFAVHESVTERAGVTKISPGHDPTEVHLLEEESHESDPLPCFQGLLTVLSDIPDAQTLDRLNPQTVTLNMLAAVIAVPPPRTVCIRRTGLDAQLLELVVGDDTRAGLQVTLWLDSLDREGHTAEGGVGLLETLASLRSGDVVLLTNVALAHFRGMVHGQSLRRDWARGGWATGISVICRQGEYASVPTASGISGRPGPIQQRLAAVQAWARHFILLLPIACEWMEGQDPRLERGSQAGDSLPPNETPQ